MKKILITTLLATASAVCVVPSTHAANVPVTAQSSTTGDFILNIAGPAASGGAATDLEIDLGASTLFASFTTPQVLSRLTLSDLNSTFGTSWNTAGLLWGGLGATKNSAGFGAAVHNTLYLTMPATTPGSSTLFNTLPGSTSGQGTQVTDANSIYVLLGNTSSTVNSGSAAVILASTNNSFTQLDGYTGAQGGTSSFGLPGGVDGTIGGSTPYLDVYSSLSQYSGAPAGTATLLGTISIDSNSSDGNYGQATFTPAVPEPASASILALGAGVLGLARRRRASISL